MSKDTLSITDNRTGKSYELPIEHGTIKAIDLRQMKVSADDFGLMTYDPAFMNTASCKSRVTFIDGVAPRTDISPRPRCRSGVWSPGGLSVSVWCRLEAGCPRLRLKQLG